MEERGEIPAFTLASRDTAIRFCVTERLYGREKEISQLDGRILSAPEAEMDIWRDELQRGIGENGRLITSLIPDMEALDEYWVRQMVADSFSRSVEESRELASCLMEKTAGNPFFVIQFLTSLHEEGILFCNPFNGSWEWDLPRLNEATSSDNVLELVTEKIKILTGSSRETIIQAACLGNGFTAELLAELQNVSPDDVSLTFAEAVTRGLLLKTANGYRFVHDRVQQAAYSLMSPDELKRCHLDCGRLLLARGGDSWVEYPFEIANHLNMAHDLLILPVERLLLCRINLAAGIKANAAASYHDALAYLKAGISLLPNDSWSTEYDVTFSLFLTLAKCSYMLSEFDTAHSYFTKVLGTVGTGLEKALIYGDMVVMYEKMEQPERAMAAGISGLRCLGIRIGRLPVKLEMLQALFSVRWLMRGRSPHELLLVPVATDQEKIAAMKILMSLIVPSYFIGKDHAALVVLTLVRLSLTHGVTEYSSYAFVSLGVIEGSLFGRYSYAHELGEAAITLARRFTGRVLRGSTEYIFAGYINNWSKRGWTSITLLHDAYQLAMESGDFNYQTYCTT